MPTSEDPGFVALRLMQLRDQVEHDLLAEEIDGEISRQRPESQTMSSTPCPTCGLPADHPNRLAYCFQTMRADRDRLQLQYDVLCREHTQATAELWNYRDLCDRKEALAMEYLRRAETAERMYYEERDRLCPGECPNCGGSGGGLEPWLVCVECGGTGEAK